MFALRSLWMWTLTVAGWPAPPHQVALGVAGCGDDGGHVGTQLVQCVGAHILGGGVGGWGRGKGLCSAQWKLAQVATVTAPVHTSGQRGRLCTGMRPSPAVPWARRCRQSRAGPGSPPRTARQTPAPAGKQGKGG